MIRFEIMLERRPGYYVTNVAIPAAIITYLCFISYTTRADGTLVETGDRLQIVLTLLLTAVTFKNQVASLIPRISYFTTLDKYVFFCFIIACVVVLENALFPVVAKYFSEENNWQEKNLLWFSIGFFTLVNVVGGGLPCSVRQDSKTCVKDSSPSPRSHSSHRNVRNSSRTSRSLVARISG